MAVSSFRIPGLWHIRTQPAMLRADRVIE